MVYVPRVNADRQGLSRAARPRRAAALALWIAFTALAASPLASADEGGKLFGYVGWDREYFYFAAKVDDRSVVGTADRPLSEPWQDDSVELCFDMAAAGGDAPTPACARLALSAAGGFTALIGTVNGTWKADPNWAMGLRFDVAVQGTINKGRDKDEGYVLEVAIPWRFLGGAPRPGYQIGFNAACHLRGEQEGFAAWSPASSVPSDLDRPSTWGRMVFESQALPTTVEGSVVQCPRLTRGPEVDGKLSPAEWMTASVLRIDLPEAQHVVQTHGAARPAQIVALYFPPAGGPGLPLAQPREGLGPWWRGDSVEWHRRQARDARLAGVDTLAIAYPPAEGNRQAPADLACLVQALKDLKGQRYTYPLLALYLGSDALAGARSAQELYGLIRDFFQAVPPEFRAQAQVDGQRASIIVLGPPAGDLGSRSFARECTSLFEKDFHGRTLLWLAEEGWKDKGQAFQGYWSGEQAFAYQPSGRLRVGTISPGRGGGQSADYYSNWVRLVNLAPDFVLINSWNDFANGTQICPSRQEGVTLVDMTRRYAAQLAARSATRLTLRGDTVPDVMLPDRQYQVELLLENNGFSDLSPQDNVGFEYEFESTGRPKVKAVGDAARAVKIPAGATVPLPAYVTTRVKKDPLPEGDYTLKLRVTRSKIPILTSPLWQQTLAEFAFPVHIGGAPPLRATIVSSSVPSQMEAGAAYPVELRMRNDGAATWKRGQLQVLSRWLRPGEQEGAEATSWQDAGSSGVQADVAPGRMATLALTAAARQDGGAALGEGSWFLEWALSQGQKDPAPVAREAVRVVKWDSGLRMIHEDVPAQMKAGDRYEALLTLGNVGPSTWKADGTRIAYRWYYLDGTPAADAVPGAQLPVDSPPGKLAVLRMAIQAPQSGGTYLLDFDAEFEGHGLASEDDGAGRGSFDPVAITVTGGRFVPVDLSGQYNTVASTTAARRASGDFDGAGRSLPAEEMPPDLSVAGDGWYPCGYYSGEPDAPRNVPFMFAPGESGIGRCVACTGQRIQLPAGPVAKLHIIAAAVRTDVEATFTVSNASGESSSVSMPIGYWLDAPQKAAERGFQTPYVRTATSDEPTPAYLRHYSLDAGGAVSLELPKDPRVRLLALTVEMQEPAPAD